MNILFVHDHEVNPFKGGMQRVSWLLAEEFSHRGHRVSFLSLRDDPQEFSSKGTFPQTTLSIDILGEAKLREEIEKYITEKNIGLVVLQHPEERYRGALSGLHEITKTVFVFHNQPYPLLGKERQVKRVTPSSSLRLKGKALRLLGMVFPKIFRKLYLHEFGIAYKSITEQVSQLILLSERYIPRVTTNTTGISKDKLVAINNPVTFQVEEVTDLMNEKENIVLVVCRLSNPQKNLTAFIDIWNEFSRRKPDWKAMIVGDGESRDAMEAYARKTKAVRLSFEGNRENVRDYYKRAKIFCMTSCYEGWPMVLMESMAFGCVPIVFDTFEAVRDMITDGEDGKITAPFDNSAMVTAMIDLADNPEKLRKMGEAGPSKIREFTTEKIVLQWESKVMDK